MDDSNTVVPSIYISSSDYFASHEQGLQGGDLLPVADHGGRHVHVPKVLDPAGARRDPVQGGVVEGEQHPVPGGVHVGLEVPVAEVDRVLERGEGVLQSLEVGVERAAAVREGEHRARLLQPGVQERVAAAGSGHSGKYSPIADRLR